MEIEMPSAPQRVPIGRVAQIALFALVIVLVMIVIFWRPEKMNTDAQSAGETPQAQFEERSLPRQQPLVVTTTRDTKQTRNSRRVVPVRSQPKQQTRSIVTKTPENVTAKPSSLSPKGMVAKTPVAGRKTPVKALVHHTMSDDDTLYSIAQKYYGRGSAWRLIARANKLNKPSQVPLGTRLLIPPTAELRQADKKESETVQREQTALPAGAKWHKVRSGENYIKIARRYWGTSSGWRKIMQVNGFDEQRLPVGKRIIVPAR